MPTHPPAILFEDNDILVINKPAGILSIPDGYNPSLPYLQQHLESEYGRLWIVHRLDKGTSGVMVLARNPEVHRRLNQSFREREVHKNYHGLIWPVPEWTEHVIDTPLKINADRRHRTRANLAQGKPAWTGCVILDKWPLAARAAITIKTGLTHQIRAHLRELGIILLGETLYDAGLPQAPIAMPRIMLHARLIEFQHPANGERVSFSAPYPDDFRAAYSFIRQTKGPTVAT